MHYTDFPDAPGVGTVLCAMSDIPAGGYFSVMLGGFPVLVVGDQAYVNACPHQFLPLDRNGSVIGADGTIICSNHTAKFDAKTGQGISGFGQGCALISIPTQIKSDNLVVA